MQDQTNDLRSHFLADAEMHRRGAECALRDVIRDAEEALRRLDREGLDGHLVRSTPGGSVLNSQRFLDAERELILLRNAVSAAALVGQGKRS